MPSACGQTVGGAWQKLSKKGGGFAHSSQRLFRLSKTPISFAQDSRSFFLVFTTICQLNLPVLNKMFYVFSPMLSTNIKRVN